MARKTVLENQYFRWMRLGPWYAMFPMQFALESIEKHTKRGDAVLDPFMGRGTTLAAATMLERNCAGVEINPIAWIYAQTKMDIANEQKVRERLNEIAELALHETIAVLPEFFDWCFCEAVLKFLLTARGRLNWRDDVVDRTLMAIILVDLHGKEETSLSNQMRQTKAMAPGYSVNWWKKRKMRPHHTDPKSLLESKITWRYRYGSPIHKTQSLALHGNSTEILPNVQPIAPFKLLLTSPPYYKIINYNYDQWIRRWMLGGPDTPSFSAGKHESDFGHQENYQTLLNDVFQAAAPLMQDQASIIVRTDARSFTLQATLNALELAFPEKRLKREDRPVIGKTQTELFGDDGKKPGEVDLVLSHRSRTIKRNMGTDQGIKISAPRP
jgi:DNA methylase